MINLITSFYLPKNIERSNEINKTLKKNIKSPFIKKIHLFLDDNKCKEYLEKNFDNKKIIIAKIGKQPLYSDLFIYSNKLKGERCMIANSDIWLHNITHTNLLSVLDKNYILSLTRHEYDFTSPLIDMYQGSHDTFIFKSPINNNLIKHIQHPQNVWGSENVLLYELNKLKYKLANPCKNIIIIHEHKTEFRNPNRKRINRGGLDGDGIYKIRSLCVSPLIIK